VSSNTVGSLEQIFRPGGLLARQLPSYEFRPSQLEMAQAVLRAIEEGGHICVEAGTGTGKTLAYLIPALFSTRRAVISTATRNLQEQLFFKDIPFVKRHLFPELKVTYMKGRQNYLCLKKLYQHGQLPIPGGSERDLRAITDWAVSTEAGDRVELHWLSDDDPVWKHLDARGETCVGQKCSHFDRCFITRMRQKAVESDLVIVNHALLFSSLALQSDEIGRVLPEFAVLILDEAHEVEDIASSHFGKEVSSYQIDELCRDLRAVFRELGELAPAIDDIEARSAQFFALFPGQEGHYSLNFFRKPSGGVLDLRLENAPGYERLRSALRLVYHQVQRRNDRPPESDSLLRRTTQLTSDLEEVFKGDDEEQVYWYERRPRGVVLRISPIDVAPILREVLFESTSTVVLTSATLTTGGSFSYMRERLGVGAAREVSVPGEFDYATQALLYVPARFPEPRSAEYFLRALKEMREILSITQGHAFLLFTSFAQMNRFYRSLLEGLPYPLLRQGDMPKSRLLEVFKTTPHAVLCATASFWQGVDVQGDALRAVIIDKLPFQVPSEPVVAARLTHLEKQGRNSFLEYSVPDAVISLRQGLGRLIRSRQDRGLLAVFDSRLRSRNYGRLFLDSLPNCPLTDNIDSLRNFFK
jgi:ATP-dependent DNA helicase DinG